LLCVLLGRTTLVRISTSWTLVEPRSASSWLLAATVILPAPGETLQFEAVPVMDHVPPTLALPQPPVTVRL
jgi:hypothetical protein